MSEVYLGDGVYTHFDGWHIVVTTSDGYKTINEIYLDPDVFRSLVNFQKQVKEGNIEPE